MTKTIILILFISGSNSGGTEQFHFKTMAECEAFRIKVVEKIDGKGPYIRANGWCIEK